MSEMVMDHDGFIRRARLVKGEKASVWWSTCDTCAGESETSPHFPIFARPPTRAYWGRAEADEVIAAILTRFALPAEKARRRDLARRAENAARFEATCATKVVS
jgi:hypothetical protein